MKTDSLANLGACEEALEWTAAQRTQSQAWRDCQRGDWMLWLLGRLSGPPESESRRRLVLCACECARLALPHVPAGEDRPRLAIEAAERWARGEASLAEVQAAAAAASSAASAASAASVAAFDAAHAASVAAAADAADAAADAADAAWAAELLRCADVVRRHYPSPPKLGGRGR